MHAYPRGQLSVEQVEQFRENSRAEARRLGTARRRVTARARAEMAPRTGGEPGAAKTCLVPTDGARELGRTTGDELLRKASTCQLVLTTRPDLGRPIGGQ